MTLDLPTPASASMVIVCVASLERTCSSSAPTFPFARGGPASPPPPPLGREPVRRLADEHLERRRGLLEARRDVDGVSRDEPLTERGVAGDDLAGVDPGAILE